MTVTRPGCRQGFRQQRGAALLLMVLLAITFGLALLFRNVATPEALRLTGDELTDQALLQAKAALIGYAATYRDTVTHSTEVFGYLPCPDTDNDGFAEPNCNAADQTVIGRLPYRTLSLPELRDAGGECLWYVVSGSHKNSPKSATAMNWDSRGHIRIVDGNGTALIDPDPVKLDPSGGAVAAVVAVGAPLTGQLRPGGNLACSGSALLTDAEVAAYLDGPVTAGVRTNHVMATATTQAAPLVVVSGHTGSTVNNDRVVAITARELFAPIAKRSDLLNPLLGKLAGCLNNTTVFHKPVTTTFADATKLVADSVGIDEVRTKLRLQPAVAGQPDYSTLCTFDDADNNAWSAWQAHFRYVVCSNTASLCLQVNSTTANCSAALLFGGQNAAGIPRLDAEKANVARYFTALVLPPNNLASLTTTTSPIRFSGGTVYNGAAPSTDIAICLTPLAEPANSLTFRSNFDSIVDRAGTTSSEGSTTSRADGTLTLGDADLDSGETDLAGVPYDADLLFGCSWFDSKLPFNTRLVAYFSYRIINKGNGFVFALADADPARNPDIYMCGDGRDSLGYSGLPNDGDPIASLPGLRFIEFPKIGLEIDTDENGSRDDPDVEDAHLALLFWKDPISDDKDNVHGEGLTPDAASPAVASEDFLAGSGLRHVRMEITRSRPDGDTTRLELKAWVFRGCLPSIPFSNTDPDPGAGFADPSPAPCDFVTVTHTQDVDDVTPGVEALHQLWIGFTNATDSNAQVIEINNFAVRTQ